MNSSSSTRSVVPNSFQPHGLQPAMLLHPWDFPGKHTGVGCHFLLQGIFQNQGSNPRLSCLLPQQVYSLPLAPPGKPFIMNAYVQTVLVTQPFLTLWDPMDCSPPGFFVHVILQARILQWVAIPFSRGFSQPRDQTPRSPALILSHHGSSSV